MLRFGLKHAIQDLIDRGLLNFQQKDVTPFWNNSKARHKRKFDPAQLLTSPRAKVRVKDYRIETHIGTASSTGAHLTPLIEVKSLLFPLCIGCLICGTSFDLTQLITNLYY
jgi:hypothetical protein